MNTLSRIIGSLIVALSLLPVPALAQAAAQPASGSSKPATPDGDRLTSTELEDLLGSIALYPDPLLANVLAASVYPDEVAEAAKFVASGGKSEEIAGKPWEDPVKAVASIPDAIKMMGEYPDWTIALGQAYLTQAKDVMDVVQSLRKKAHTNGALVSTPQQDVVVEKEIVYIKSADPEIVYVPSYSPSVVYVDDDDDEFVAGVVGFGVGITAGLIIANNMDCHWHGGCVGWGWGHGGYYGGHNDIDIDRNVNRNTNIQGGDRTTNITGGDRTSVSGGDRTSVKGGDRVSGQNRVGNEGNAWSPNKSKSLASSKPSEAGRVKQGAANRPAMPGGGSSRPTAGNKAAGGAAGGARPAQTPASKPAAGKGAAKPSQKPAAKPKVPASRPPAASTSQRSSGGGGASASRSPSAYEGGSGTRSASDRGNASRSSSSSYSGGGGGSRSSGGGGGGRSGGGGRGGGRR